MKIYDITAEIGPSLPPYGDTGHPTITAVAQMANGDFCNVSKMKLSTHTGTHADMPLHFVDGTANCVSVPLEHFYGPAKVMSLDINSHVTKADLVGLDISAGDIILLNTGQSKYMSQPGFKADFLALTPEAAEYLVSKKIMTIGIDYLSVDPYDTTDYAVHKILLGNGIVVLEGLVLDGVPDGEYFLSALPLKIENGDGSPVRAVLSRMK